MEYNYDFKEEHSGVSDNLYWRAFTRKFWPKNWWYERLAGKKIRHMEDEF